jgi:hypothetical protein
MTTKNRREPTSLSPGTRYDRASERIARMILPSDEQEAFSCKGTGLPPAKAGRIIFLTRRVLGKDYWVLHVPKGTEREDVQKDMTKFWMDLKVLDEAVRRNEDGRLEAPKPPRAGYGTKSGTTKENNAERNEKARHHFEKLKRKHPDIPQQKVYDQVMAHIESFKNSKGEKKYWPITSYRYLRIILGADLLGKYRRRP